MKKLLTRGSVLATALVISACQDAAEPVAIAASVGSGSDTECVGTLPPGTYDNVVVPRGEECFLENSTVRGNVKALEDSRLFVVDDIVHGNVEGDKASTVQVVRSTVHGNIHIIEGHDLFTASAAVFRTSLPNGNIQIEKGRHPLGDFFVVENTLDKGNIRAEENSSDFDGLIADNIVAQDVQVFKNTQPIIEVVDNVIGENLQCKENTEPFVGEPNVVGGNAEDQCAGSAITAATASARVLPELREFPLLKRTR